jgi:hypothetical protein
LPNDSCTRPAGVVETDHFVLSSFAEFAPERANSRSDLFLRQICTAKKDFGRALVQH